eukprot:GHVL01024824.1.p2 GENE.GHVL01024824.1~~GHVL01024824.1.p2  ORF type:complete len:105 (-),score=12.59 GHVL01024824.1:102-416(-)
MIEDHHPFLRQLERLGDEAEERRGVRGVPLLVEDIDGVNFKADHGVGASRSHLTQPAVDRQRDSLNGFVQNLSDFFAKFALKIRWDVFVFQVGIEEEHRHVAGL